VFQFSIRGVEALFGRLSPQRWDWISDPCDSMAPNWGMEGGWFGSGF